VRAAIVNGNLEDSLNVLPVQKGNMIFVDAGTVHAIWPGAILLETQQNCDLTYRMYDYGRPRELHVEKSLEALRLTTQAGKVAALKIADRTILVKGSYFCVEQLPVHDSRKSSTLAAEDEPGGMLSYLFAASGSTRIRSIEHRFEAIDLPTCGVVAIPSNTYPFVVEDQSCSKSLDKLNLLRISTRWP